MIIKQADARTHDIDLLKHIKSLSHISREQAKRVEKELISIRSGLKGEREAAYHIDFHYGAGENYAIIHDLRLEHEGRVAQIDHLIIGRMLQTFLCETKYWSDGVSINEQGEFSAHYGQRKIGVPSPIMQNARHIKVLSSLLNSGQIERPKRLGMKLPFTLNPITLVSTGANIQRPEGLNQKKYAEIVKIDHLNDYMTTHFDSNMSPFSLGKLVSADTLRSFAEGLSELHKPLKIDYWKKFGINPSRPSKGNTSSPSVSSHPLVIQSSQSQDTKTKKRASQKQYFCNVCKAEVELKVARFCWFNKKRFNGEIRCRTHQ